MPRRNHTANSDGKTQRDPNAAMRAIMALDLFAQGLSYEEIAAKAGYASRGAAFNAIQRELDRCVSDKVAEVRKKQGYQLSRALRVVMKRIMVDDKDSLWAIDRLVPLLKRQAELFSLDVKADGLPAGATLVREIGTDLGQL